MGADIAFMAIILTIAAFAGVVVIGAGALIYNFFKKK